MRAISLLVLATLTIVALACGPGAAPPGANPQPSPPTSSTGLRYGFQVDYGNDYQRAFKLTRDANFGWAKVQVRWADWEKSKGSIDWSYMDQVVDAATAQGLNLLISITTTPMWARPSGSSTDVDGPPSDSKTFADFLKALAGRYKGKVGAYEVWNEQNLSREWGGPGKVDSAGYVTMLKAAYPAIKGADKDAIVVTGALTPSGDVAIPEQGGELARDDVEYFRDMYRSGIKGSFDAVGVHPGGFNNAPDLDPKDPAVLNRSGGFHGHRSFYFRNFERYREVMVEQGDQDKQLWFTEFGWASGQAGA